MAFLGISVDSGGFGDFGGYMFVMLTEYKGWWIW